jgi:ubiquinone biosynthesis protein COQ9
VNGPVGLGDRVADAAAGLAREIGWERISLHRIAERLGLSLTELRRTFADLDAVGDAVVARADAAMLSASDQPQFRDLPVRARLETSLVHWLDHLATDRRSLRKMIRYKLRPAHVHHQAALVVALSRKVQWWREAALLTAIGRVREREEVFLTAVFLATFLSWLCDRSSNQRHSKRFLHRALSSPISRTLWPN